MILDKYFKRPTFYDYTISIIIVFLLYISYNKCFLVLPKIERSLSMTSDLANVGITSAGFILTLLTVLITFKSSSNIKKNNYHINSANDFVFLYWNKNAEI